MADEKITVQLSDRSQCHVARSDTGMVYLTMYVPGAWKAGQETMSIKCSTILPEATIRGLIALLKKGRS